MEPHDEPRTGGHRLGAAVSKVLAGKRLVVVDDAAIIRLDIENTLREAGATITRSFENGADAAVLDIWLGQGSTSISLAEALHERKIPFLFYTGLSLPDLAEIRDKWPGCRILSKPADPGAIIAAVADLFRQVVPSEPPFRVK
jgi:superfamily I DNA/RNA helicase